MLQELTPQRAIMRNAADVKQIRNAERITKRRYERLHTALRSVMNSPEGRLVFWELLTASGVFRSIWEANARIHYNAGRQDFGHEILADLHAVDEDLYQLMEREMRQLAKRDAAEVDGQHTAPARAGADDSVERTD